MRSISRAETESCRSNLRSAVPDKSRDSSRPENINFRLVVRQRTFVFQINNDSVCAFFNLNLGLKRLFREASEISDKLFLPFKAWQGYLLSSHKLLSPMFFYGYVHHVVRQHFSGSQLSKRSNMPEKQLASLLTGVLGPNSHSPNSARFDSSI